MTIFPRFKFISSGINTLRLLLVTGVTLCILLLLGFGTSAQSYAGLSPDLTKFVFTKEGDDRKNHIFVVNADGTNQTLIHSSDMSGSKPQWSPDGKKILFESKSYSDKDRIFVFDVATQNKIEIGDFPKNNSDSPVWSPDSKKIAFTNSQPFRPGTLGEDVKSRVFVVDADGRNQIEVSNLSTNSYDPEWSPDSAKIVFKHSNVKARYSREIAGNTQRVFIVDADGKNRTQINNLPATLKHTTNWSPDSKKLMIMLELTEGRNYANRIFVVDADGQNTTALTPLTTGGNKPYWSPNSEKLFFTSFTDDKDRWALAYVIKADGTNLKEIKGLPNTSAYYPHWSPDSKKLAIQTMNRYGGGNELFVVDADGTNQVLLSVPKISCNQPVWSPGSNKIVFNHWAEGNSQVLIVDADGTNQTRISAPTEISKYSQEWSPDGEKIIFIHQDRDPENEASEFPIFVADSEGQHDLVNLKDLASEDQKDPFQIELNNLVQQGINAAKESNTAKYYDVIEQLKRRGVHPYNTLKCVNRACSTLILTSFEEAETEKVEETKTEEVGKAEAEKIEEAETEKVKNKKLSDVMWALAGSIRGLHRDIGPKIAAAFPSTWWDRYRTRFALNRLKIQTKQLDSVSQNKVPSQI